MIPVKVSDRALEEIKKTIAHKNIPAEYGLRIGVNGGGVPVYLMCWVFDKKGQGDSEFALDNVPVYIAKKDTMFLLGMEVDFYEGNDARGFTFIKSDEKQKSL